MYSGDIFFLHHPKTLRRLTSALKVDSGLSSPTITYLKLRVDQLEPRGVSWQWTRSTPPNQLSFGGKIFSYYLQKKFCVSLKSLHPGILSAKWRRTFVLLSWAAARHTLTLSSPDGLRTLSFILWANFPELPLERI